ncbi:lysine--tRNA ligase [bacterium]|nr:lysine--tRNA ligase [bacterium]
MNQYPDFLEERKSVWSVIGRIHSKRGGGKIMFLDLVEGSDKIQIFLEKASLENFDTLKKVLDNGDIIGVTGWLFVTKQGELTIHVTDCRLLSKCLIPIPFGKEKDGEHFHGLEDTDQRYRRRHVHLNVDTDQLELFKSRSLIISHMRGFLGLQGFYEVETPILQPLRGGANAKPFETHYEAVEQDMYLRIAPELYLKRLLVAGFDAIFEIGKNFRNEGIDTTHSPEFTMLEAYQVDRDYIDGMDFVERFLWTIASAHGCDDLLHGKYERISFMEALRARGFEGNDLESAKQFAEKNGLEVAKGNHYAQVLDLIFKKLVVKETIQATFFYDYPIETSPLAKQKADDPSIVERFQLVCNGLELVNGFSELNDPFEQRKRFEAQLENARSGDEEAMPLDEDFLEALEMGMPPAVGFGIGIDRLVMVLKGSESIRDVILFPTLKKENNDE